MEEHQTPIWYFIGLILALYGANIFVTGLVELVNPPPVDQRVKLWDLHAAVWWGAILLGIGLGYTFRFRPGRARRGDLPNR